jgi:hypothetical protein
MKQVNNLREFWYRSITLGYRTITPGQAKSLKKLESRRYRSITPEATNPQGLSTDLWVTFRPRLLG